MTTQETQQHGREKLNREKVFNKMKEEIARIEKLQQLEEPTESEEHREPLSIDITKTIKILLSWGGGEDGFKLRFCQDELIGGVYYMADWGEYEEIELNEEEREAVFQFYLFGEAPKETTT